MRGEACPRGSRVTSHCYHRPNTPVEPAQQAAGDTFGTLESVKAVSALFMPVSGEVVAINEGLAEIPEAVNQDPYGKGWMIRIKIRDAGETGQLMSAKAYEAYIAEKE